jgi:hypothetical protein
MFSNSLKQKIIGSNPADVSISRTGKYGFGDSVAA